MTTFRAMSDLVADAEDLLAKMGDSTSPDIRALKAEVESSIAEMKQQFRRRVKERVGSDWGAIRVVKAHPWLSAAAVAAVAAYLCRQFLAER